MRLELQSRIAIGKWLVLALIAVIVLPMSFPHLAYAQAESEPTFEIKIEKIGKFLKNNIMIALEENEDLVLVSSKIDPLQARKDRLYHYFTQIRPSRFANHIDTLAEQPYWRKVIAIAFVESTLGKKCYVDNCWGITYSSGLAKFKSLDEGIQTHNDLIARRYADKTYQQMNCVYVVPCNPSWVRGTLQIETELDKYVEVRVQ